MVKEVRYSTQILVDGDGPFEERIRVEQFASAPELELVLGAQEIALTEVRCPACGTRMKDVAKHSPVPKGLKGLLSCANLACPGRDILHLPGQDGLEPIGREDYRRQLEKAREVGRRRIVARGS